MAKINYQFADGHFEQIECTEEFKREYEFLLVREKATYWKEMKQKERAGLRCSKDFSLEKFSEDGFEISADTLNPLEQVIKQEEQREYYDKLLEPLTDKQREVYILHFLKGIPKLKIATLLHIDESSVRERLRWAQKKILKNFLKHPRI